MKYPNRNKTTPINFPLFLICLIFIRAFVYFFLEDSLSIGKILEQLGATVLIVLFSILAITSLKHYSFTEKGLIVRFLGIPVRSIDWRAVSHAVYSKQWRVNKGKIKYKFAISVGKGNAIFVSLYGCPPYDPESDALSDFSMIHGRNILCIHLPSKTAEEYVNAFQSCYPDLIVASETGLYYCQSRYYDPEIGRFINADAFASTGQGLLGNNMFAYCGNNPVCLSDPTGNVPSFRPVYFDRGENQRIYNQREEPYASKILGDYTVSYNGCGAIATYNALGALGNPKSFDEVLTYYNKNPLRTFMNGKFGILPHQVAEYFISEGYRTDISCTRTGIENNSKTADACIMFYVFPQIINGWTLPGAHFVQYETCGNTYVAYNTGSNDGFSFFESPVDYGLSGDRYIVIGIFIFED